MKTKGAKLIDARKIAVYNYGHWDKGQIFFLHKSRTGVTISI